MQRLLIFIYNDINKFEATIPNTKGKKYTSHYLTEVEGNNKLYSKLFID